jgi:gas vesicle protein
MLVALIGLIGVVIGSSIAFFIDYKKHKWKREEKIQELFISEKMNRYKELINLLTELRYNISLAQLGEEVLRFPKDKRISPEFCKNERDDNIKEQLRIAKDIHERIEQLKIFVQKNSLFLSKNVKIIFWSNFYRLLSWKTRVNIRNDKELAKEFPDFFNDINKTLDNLLDLTKEAIYKDLDNSNEDILTIKELNEIKNSNLVKKK